MWRAVAFCVVSVFLVVVAIQSMNAREPEPPLPATPPRVRMSLEYYRARRSLQKAFRQPGLPFEAVSFANTPDLSSALSLAKYREMQKMARIVMQNLGPCEPCCGEPLTCEDFRDIDSLTLEIESSAYFGSATVTLFLLPPLPPETPGSEIVSFQGASTIDSHEEICGAKTFQIYVTAQCDGEGRLNVYTYITSRGGDIQADFYGAGGELGTLPVNIKTPLSVGDAIFNCPDMLGCTEGGAICGSTIPATLME